jgi:predicted acyltransferase
MADASSTQAPISNRIASIDALRGFDMLWITGGEEVIHSLYKAHPNTLTAGLSLQFRHVAWQGFHFEDLIFPLFVFIVGVVLPFSLTRRLEAGANRAKLYAHVVRRLLLLFLRSRARGGLLLRGLHFRPRAG